MKLPIALLSMAMAGALLAQTAPSAVQSKSHARAANPSVWMVQRLTKDLALTPDQQMRVKAIFDDAKEQAKAQAPKVREERAELKAAMKADSESKIDEITQQNAQLNAQMQALHAKTMAKVYAALTPQQKIKFDNMDFRHRRRGETQS